ncbi:MAG: hypothetical protein U9N73_01790 [Candidatus Auribacterota bacterium]|nr:hypothetical protein [Candidatus Auribacterota bacterium]
MKKILLIVVLALLPVTIFGQGYYRMRKVVGYGRQIGSNTYQVVRTPTQYIPYHGENERYSQPYRYSQQGGNGYGYGGSSNVNIQIYTGGATAIVKKKK